MGKLGGKTGVTSGVGQVNEMRGTKVRNLSTTNSV